METLEAILIVLDLRDPSHESPAFMWGFGLPGVNSNQIIHAKKKMYYYSSGPPSCLPPYISESNNACHFAVSHIKT